MSGPRGEAVVVGGGIGGLTAAIELRRTGFEVVVCERRDELAEVNTGFLLWSLAIKRLRALGLGAGIEEIGEPLERLITTDHHGRLLSDLRLDDLNRRAGAPSYDVHRAGLQRLLAAELGEEHVRLGARCVGIGDESGRPAAILEDGERIEGDLLVGADGVHSTVRRHVCGEVELRRGDIGVWRGVAVIDHSRVPSGHHFRVVGPQGLFGAGRLDDREVRWYAAAPMPERDPEKAASKRLLEGLFGAWAEPAPSVIGATPDDAILFNDTPRARPLRRWVRGRVALLGDAAHAALPALASGGGMAIEDAGVLGEALREDGGVEAGLDRYQRRRKWLTARVQWESVAFGRVLSVRARPLLWARDIGFRIDWIQRREIEHLMRGAALR